MGAGMTVFSLLSSSSPLPFNSLLNLVCGVEPRKFPSRPRGSHLDGCLPHTRRARFKRYAVCPLQEVCPFPFQEACPFQNANLFGPRFPKGGIPTERIVREYRPPLGCTTGFGLPPRATVK